MDIIIPPFKAMVSTRPMYGFRSVAYTVELPSFTLSEGAAEDAYATFISSNFPDQLKLMKYICYTVPGRSFQDHLTTALCPHVDLNGYLGEVLDLVGRVHTLTDGSLYHTRLAWADHMAKHIAMQLGGKTMIVRIPMLPMPFTLPLPISGEVKRTLCLPALTLTDETAYRVLRAIESADFAQVLKDRVFLCMAVKNVNFSMVVVEALGSPSLGAWVYRDSGVPRPQTGNPAFYEERLAWAKHIAKYIRIQFELFNILEPMP